MLKGYIIKCIYYPLAVVSCCHDPEIIHTNISKSWCLDTHLITSNCESTCKLTFVFFISIDATGLATMGAPLNWKFSWYFSLSGLTSRVSWFSRTKEVAVFVITRFNLWVVGLPRTVSGSTGARLTPVLTTRLGRRKSVNDLFSSELLEKEHHDDDSEDRWKHVLLAHR